MPPNNNNNNSFLDNFLSNTSAETEPNEVFDDFISNVTESGKKDSGFDFFGSILSFLNLQNIEQSGKNLIEYAVLWIMILNVMNRVCWSLLGGFWNLFTTQFWRVFGYDVMKNDKKDNYNDDENDILVPVKIYLKEGQKFTILDANGIPDGIKLN